MQKEYTFRSLLLLKKYTVPFVAAVCYNFADENRWEKGECKDREGGGGEKMDSSL